MTTSHNSNERDPEESGAGPHDDCGFSPLSMVVLTMHSPREKFWGALLTLNAAGVSVRGWLLDSIDDCIRQLRAGERVDTSVVFFPMHRVERMELDTRNGEIPSLSERFESKTGVTAEAFFARTEVNR